MSIAGLITFYYSELRIVQSERQQEIIHFLRMTFFGMSEHVGQVRREAP